MYIHDFSRLARSTKDLLELVEQLQKKGVHLISNKEKLDTGTPTGKLMLTMIAAINEFERQNLLDRQREGIDIAKRNGVYKGRKRVAIRGTPKFCVKSNECRNRANLYVGGSGLTVCRLCLQHNAGGDGCQGRRSRSFDP